MDAKTVALVGAAVAAPVLLRKASAAGVPIPAYVTVGHRAALAELDAQGFRGSEQAMLRYGEFNARMLKTRGPAPSKPHKANLTDEDLFALCDAFLDAAHAGVMVDDREHMHAEQYQLTRAQAWTPMEQQLRDAVWNKLTEADQRELTDFGRACARVMKVRDGLSSGFLSSPEDILGGNLAVGQLAIEMDDQGYRITGAPDYKTIAGGLDAAAEAVGVFAAERTADAAKAALVAVWTLVKAEPLFWGGVGFVAWRVLR